MARVELDNTRLENRSEGKIGGNIWVFSNPGNLKPFKNIYPTGEHKDLSLVTETARGVVEVIRDKFIQKEWWFNSVMIGDRSLCVVLINHHKGATTQQCPRPIFLKPEVLKARPSNNLPHLDSWELPTEPINELLKAANLYAYNAYGDYNSLKLQSRRGLFSKHTQESIYYQSGIALVSVNFRSIEDEIGIIKGYIQDIRDTIRKKGKEPNSVETAALAELEAEQRKLTASLASNPNPAKLLE